MFLLADQLFLVTALIILNTEGFSCIVMSWGSLCYLYLVQLLGFVVRLQCKIRVNCMPGGEGSANLTCEEKFGGICLLSFFLWRWDSALWQNSGQPVLVLIGFSGCAAFPRGAQHMSGQSPDLRRGQKKNHRGWGKDVKWNKFEAYIGKREWGTIQKAGMEDAENLQATPPEEIFLLVCRLTETFCC